MVGNRAFVDWFNSNAEKYNTANFRISNMGDYAQDYPGSMLGFYHIGTNV